MGWNHAGISVVKELEDGSYGIRIPDRLFKEFSILFPGDPVYWSFEKTVGFLLASNQRLKKDNYKTVGYSKFRGKDNGFNCVIPKKFFSDYDGGAPVEKSVPEKYRVKLGERRHVMFRDEAAETHTKSCFLFTDLQFEKRFSDSNKWQEQLSDVPRFH